jgi:hypothetical protein
MKKIILIISLIVISVALLYGSFKVFYRFNRLEISIYYWSKYYKDGSRDYFLSKEEQSYDCEVDFKNPKKEAIYFGLFDYLISEKDTIEVSKNKVSKQDNGNNRIFRSNLDPFYEDIETLLKKPKIIYPDEEKGSKDSGNNGANPLDLFNFNYYYWANNEAIKIDNFSGEAIKLKSYVWDGWDGVFKKLKIPYLSEFDDRNIKCKQAFKNGKPHGTKTINLDDFKIQEIYDDGKLIECKVWSKKTKKRNQEPELIYEESNENGIMNVNQIAFQPDQKRIDSIFNKFLITLISLLLIESLIIFLFVKRIKKINK